MSSSQPAAGVNDSTGAAYNGTSPSAAAAKGVIDESLYSRQLYVLGHDAMHKMISSSVLIIGMKGLGIEIAKNVILAGVKSVTIYDPNPVELADLSSQYYLGEGNIGAPRDASCISKLAELNDYVPVDVLGEAPLTEAALSRFQVVVVSDESLAIQLAINEITHKSGIAFIAAETRGLFASVFCDFGDGFTVSDVTGEPPQMGMVSGVTKEAVSVVTCLEETRHGLEDGDYVTFHEVKGMTELNGCKARKVQVLGPYTFSIGDTTAFEDYISGGIFEQVKQPRKLSFKPLQESLASPEYLISDFAKMDRMAQLHVAFQAVHAFVAKNGRLPMPRSESDANEFLLACETINSDFAEKPTLDAKLLREFASEARGSLAPMTAFIGGMVAQEVLKACSGKFHPIKQHFYFDSLESLPDNLPTDESEFALAGSRYDGQIAVFGRSFQQKIANSHGFIVGAGAIGCELLKICAMMGVSTGPNGQLFVTDMDNIEKSNLNRQFLFRSWDVSKPKSRSAAKAVCSLNPDLNDKIVSFVDRVGPETENIFDDKFFDSLDFVANALDNVDARKYMDRRCVYFRKPLLESGTLGTKGNTQVVVPHMTESYSSSQDPPEKTIPFCTLHNFPNTIEHTVEWAMDAFTGTFHNDPESVNRYLTQADSIETLSQSVQGQKERLESIVRCLVVDRPLTFEQCIMWARLRFEEYYSNNIKQLLFNFPKDSVTSTGTLFWSGPKRAPSPIIFDISNEVHMNFVISGANLRAANYGLRGETDRELFVRVLNSMAIPEFKPKTGVKISVTESEAADSSSAISSTAEDVAALVKLLPSPSSMPGYQLHPAEFEKDDDTNFHIDFVAAAANLRATNYEIANATRHKIKQIAGKIIPAIATTTALVAGMACLELYKVIDNCKNLERYKNGFANLALPFFAFSEPIAAPKLTYGSTSWTLWDRFDVDDMLLKDLLEHFLATHKLRINMLSYGSSMLFGFIRQKEKLEERMQMRISQLVETVSKKAIPEHVTALVLEMLAEDCEGEDVDVPYIRLRIRGD